MKAQKLGLVLGMNMAVACMVMQGCKAVKPGSDVPPPAVDNTNVTVVEPVSPEPAPSTTVTTVAVAEPEPAPAPAPASVVVAPEPQPSKVATVRPLPPPGRRPVPTVKPVAAVKPVAEVKPVAPVAAVKPVAPVATTVYTVQAGDSLSRISKRTNIRMGAIVAANPGLNPDRIRVGQKINIPGSMSAAPAVSAVPAQAVAADVKVAKDAKVLEAAAPAPVVAANVTAPVKTKSAFKPYVGATKEYKVRSGDSLGKIAYENGISIRALKELNKLTKDSVRVGQALLIPAEKVVAEKPAAPVAKATPEVKPSEVKAPAVVAAKPVEKAAPAVEVKAPAVAPEKPVEAAAPVAAPEKPAEAAPVTAAPEVKAPVAEKPAEAPASAGATYTVKENDDIVSVAIAWGISPSQLMDLNDLKAGDAIKPGQVLKLPANAKQTAQ